jgi:hypothetical protein
LGNGMGFVFKVDIQEVEPLDVDRPKRVDVVMV